MGLVVSVGGGGGAVCVSLAGGDDPSSQESTVRSDGDVVYWYAPRSVTYSVAGE